MIIYLAPVNFEEYLQGKKIDREAFQKAEPSVYAEWQRDFEQMHPNSFTVQKLNLINPIRRKYQLKEPVLAAAPAVAQPPTAPAGSAPARPGKPVIKPKPKF